MNAADPVRVELEAALRRDLIVLPVLLDGASMPGPGRAAGNDQGLRLPQRAGGGVRPRLQRAYRPADPRHRADPRCQVQGGAEQGVAAAEIGSAGREKAAKAVRARRWRLCCWPQASASAPGSGSAPVRRKSKRKPRPTALSRSERRPQASRVRCARATTRTRKSGSCGWTSTRRRVRRNPKRQKDEPGCCRNATSSSDDLRPRISFRCGKRPKRSMISLCRTAKSRLSGLPRAVKSPTERA
jgi:hypothetical protein